MSKSDQEILDSIASVLQETSDVRAESVQLETKFVEDLDIDSLTMVETAVALQEEFGMDLSEEQMRNLSRVQDVVDYIKGAEVTSEQRLTNT